MHVKLPTALRNHARWTELGPDRVPAMIVEPRALGGARPPVVLWMHGRTVQKEIDPGRYLRWLRAGIGACAVDLPGHGERYDAALQSPARAFDVVERTLGEIDGIVEALSAAGVFDTARLGIGGVSAGGMAVLARLCREHPFAVASVEATTGSWHHQRHRPMFRDRWAEAEALDPITHLDGWREIPFQAFHAEGDQWLPIEGQASFIEALRRRYADPALIEFVRYDHTGAPYEHAGFGRKASDAKNRQAAFLRRHLGGASPAG